MSGQIIYISDKSIKTFKWRIYSLPMNLHKHQLYLLEQQFGQQLLVLTLRVNS